jgi:hypothetical protein
MAQTMTVMLLTTNTTMKLTLIHSTRGSVSAFTGLWGGAGVVELGMKSSSLNSVSYASSVGGLLGVVLNMTGNLRPCRHWQSITTGAFRSPTHSTSFPFLHFTDFKKKKKKFKYFTGGWRGGLQDNYLLSTHSSTTKQQTVPSEADTRHVRRDDVTEISFFDTQFSAQCTEAAEQDEETQSQVLGHFFFSLN